MKHIYFIATLAIAVLLGSCKKEGLNNTALDNATTANDGNEMAVDLQGRAPVTKYGAYIGAPPKKNRYDFEMNVAGQLGISCLREAVKVPAISLDQDLVPQLRTQYKVVLNFTSQRAKGTEPGTQIGFRTDTKKYKQDLNDILNTFTVMPVVAAIENEEANTLYYNGPAKDYITELRAAISVMHARGIKVADGGLTSMGIDYLVYQDLMAQGKTDSAQQFQVTTRIQPDSPKTIARGAFTDTLLTNFAMMNLDFVNFHRKGESPDTVYLHHIVNYIKKRTGKKIISNELGQMDYDPQTLLNHVQLCKSQGFPYVLWYSPDQDAGKRGTPLQYPDGTLTPSGIAYRDYISKQ